ncbi:MAG: cytochrome P450 [Rhodobacteraceae bacterium]|nr:cytochrome P450 [Paracoccaceae bacterium]
MKTIRQSPTDPDFVQNPYPFYDRLRALGPIVRWEDYGLPVTASATVTGALLRDRRLGREIPAERAEPVPAHLAPFHAVEDHSMLELEPPRHTRLRGLVLRAFTTRRIAALAPEIAALAHDLIDGLPADGPFDLIAGFARPLPVRIIARLLGVPEERADDLLAWSNAMVAMYQARRSRETEEAAATAAAEFAAFIRAHAAARRAAPGDDLISHLLAAQDADGGLTEAELVSTCILLLNAGHEATVHTIGNGVKALLQNRAPAAALAPDRVADTVEEILRFDPPLHLFTRWVYEEIEIAGHTFHRGDRIGCLLAGANRDPGPWDDPEVFDPSRPAKTNLAFGAGVHFCVGAPLARLELQISLPILFDRLPRMGIAEKPVYANLYHFHGLERLVLNR